ncbi:hypothetical protein [Parapedobacter defluvii]|uniref:hypothetical protein n=1 Tax=Parapedobacter defluvii TaxID=2045106 RepID=UPI00166E1254|nr:hypothetical protein [Parapedobacter defluvii]
MKIKFTTEAHKRNFDLVMKSREEQRRRPLDLKAVLERMKYNSQDHYPNVPDRNTPDSSQR